MKIYKKNQRGWIGDKKAEELLSVLQNAISAFREHREFESYAGKKFFPRMQDNKISVLIAAPKTTKTSGKNTKLYYELLMK